jgi:hypothetical protein
MVVTYSQDASLKEALVKTFDGKHPCSLCKEIAKGRHSEKKSEFPQQLNKLDLLTPAAQFLLTAPAHFRHVPIADNFFRSLSLTPPTPPPRSFL